MRAFKLSDQEKEARDLVERARLGDQNAQAIIVNTGKNAQKGDPVAKSAYQYLSEYIKEHPAKADMGAEDMQKIGILRAVDQNPLPIVIGVLRSLPESKNMDVIGAACVALSKGSPWNGKRVRDVNNCFSGEEQKYFQYGLSNGGKQPIPQNVRSQPAIGAICTGHCIGIARRIQLMRLPNATIGSLVKQGLIHPDIGWELGC